VLCLYSIIWTYDGKTNERGFCLCLIWDMEDNTVEWYETLQVKHLNILIVIWLLSFSHTLHSPTPHTPLLLVFCPPTVSFHSRPWCHGHLCLPTEAQILSLWTWRCLVIIVCNWSHNGLSMTYKKHWSQCLARPCLSQSQITNELLFFIFKYTCYDQCSPQIMDHMPFPKKCTHLMKCIDIFCQFVTTLIG